MGGWAWLAIAIIAEIVATSALKASDGFQRPIPVAMVVVGYAIAFVALSLTLRSLPLGVTYAVWSAIGIIGATVIGLLIFGEALRWQQYLGIAVILAGVVLVNAYGS